MNDNPYESPQSTGQPLSSGESALQKPRRLGRRLVQVLLVVAIVGVLVALLLPAHRGAREAPRRAQCTNNLKQIALALHNYESDYHALPPAYTVDADGKPLHSWRTLILPYLEQKSLYEKIDLSRPWDDPANKEAFKTEVAAYVCPSAYTPDMLPNHTTYMAVVDPGGCFQPTKPRRMVEITDDPEFTLMVLEVAPEHAVPWMSPKDVGEEEILSMLNSAAFTGLSRHPGGGNAAFVAGNVFFLSENLAPATLRALISIDGDDDAVAQQVD
jgi:type II secretory pathway pseudopilin PulG